MSLSIGIMIFFLILIFAHTYISDRLFEAELLKKELLEITINYDNHHYYGFLTDTDSAYFWFYSNLPSKNYMALSFKPLVKEHWVPEEILHKLLS